MDNFIAPNSVKCDITHHTVQKVKVVCSMKDKLDVMDSLYGQGFNITSSGPYTNKDMFPKADIKRCLFRAERQIIIGE